ncbi:SAM-dependent methyltransferase [Paenibacillus mesophilus]|uniref:class I SAM-dependent methyltransferase n=1 Tax=Paenibacillus mesophilus TaxID=2582849 RepID=UPI00110E6FE0|nr:SAM-dependent methyltransferase [Paenibacillus mesophilus]TMV46686.1 SAM-dependent methyltransferase [Paenibacillus mesophilus]
MRYSSEKHTPLTDVIVAAINRNPNKAIPFRDYMELCLYHETLGYYNRDSAKVGKEGDFYTSASIGSIMGEILGACFIRMARRLSGPEETFTIVEWGGGTGRLAGLILDTIAERDPELYKRLDYMMYEVSPYHRRLQLTELERHPNVRHADTNAGFEPIPERSVVVFSNELLDAFPVHRIERKDGLLHEWHVGWDDGTGQFTKKLFPLEQDGPAAVYIENQGIAIREGQIIEVNPAAADWIRRVGERLAHGTLVTIDYGDTAEELFASHRMKGTFLCYRNHQAYDDPFAYPGEQDMTAHVDFTACIRAGEEAGFTEWSLRTQQQFLIDEGVLDMLASHDGRDPFSPQAKRNRAVRQLLISDQMSELFKVLVQTKKR